MRRCMAELWCTVQALALNTHDFGTWHYEVIVCASTEYDVVKRQIMYVTTKYTEELQAVELHTTLAARW